jgi:hypothetical protein
VTDPSALLLPVLSLLAGVIILRTVAVVTGGIAFDSWGAAFGAAITAYFVGWGAMYVMPFVWPQAGLQSGIGLDSGLGFVATTALVQTIVNCVSLAVAASVISGIHVKGVLGLLLAAIGLTAVNLAMAYLPFVLPAQF